MREVQQRAGLESAGALSGNRKNLGAYWQVIQ
jgi:hypothetical protein